MLSKRKLLIEVLENECRQLDIETILPNNAKIWNLFISCCKVGNVTIKYITWQAGAIIKFNQYQILKTKSAPLQTVQFSKVTNILFSLGGLNITLVVITRRPTNIKNLWGVNALMHCEFMYQYIFMCIGNIKYLPNCSWIHNGRNERQRANGVFTYTLIYAYENLLRFKMD